MPPVVSVRNISRRFGYRLILDRVNFEVEPGEVIGIMGPNGAGKTTLLRIVAGITKPTSGAVEVSGILAMVGHSSMLYDALSASENLRFCARLYGLADEGTIDSTLDLVGLSKWRNQRVGTFSRGMTQRLAIARALLVDPPLLLLDEPMTGLDDTATEIVYQVLLDLRAKGTSMLIVTHQTDPVVQLATSMGFLVGGRMEVIEKVDNRSASDIAARYKEIVHGG